jgi:DNA-directed RNA polymerase specialized sigma24 family protein
LQGYDFALKSVRSEQRATEDTICELTRIVGVLDDGNVSAREVKDRLGDAVAKLYEQYDSTIDAVASLTEQMDVVKRAIRLVGSERKRLILTMLYIEGVDIGTAARAACVTVRHANRLKESGLDELEQKLKKMSQMSG